MQIYATNETRTFCAMDDHVERSVLTSIKTKTVPIKSLFFPGKKVFYFLFQLHVSHCAFNKFIKD